MPNPAGYLYVVKKRCLAEELLKYCWRITKTEMRNLLPTSRDANYPKKEGFVAVIKKVIRLRILPPGPMEFHIPPMLLALTLPQKYWRIRQNYLEERLSLAMLR